MDQPKKYELLVFLTIYFIFIALLVLRRVAMVPVGVKMPRIFMGYMEDRYGPAQPGPAPPDYTRRAGGSHAAAVVVVLGGAAVLALGTYYGRRGYRKLTRRDYRAVRDGRAECLGALAQRPNCRHYRPTPATECINFLGRGDEGMCVRKAPAAGRGGAP